MADPAVRFPRQHRQAPLPWDVEAAFAPQLPRVSFPVSDGGPNVQAAAGAPGALSFRFSRHVMPRSGVLRDFTYWVGVTGGNVIGAVYDVGQADPTQFTKKWDSGSVAVGGVNSWQTLGALALDVHQGDSLNLGVVFDGAVASYGRGTALVANQAARLPANFLPDTGNNQRLLAGVIVLAGFAAPATIAQGGPGGLAHSVMAIARIADS